MSIYICPACQREYDEDYGFCHECGGRLVEKEKNDPALNLGDANAISGGVSINQSKNISSHDTHYHTTTVQERVKSESELKLEATNQLRAKAEEIMAERGRIDSFAMNQLRPLSKQLGIDDETFKSIIKDVRSNRDGVANGLRAADARYLQQAQHAVLTNDMEGLSNLTHRLEAMAAISQDEDVQYLYYLTYALQYPIKSMEVYERQTDENYWRTFWAIVSYIRTGKHAEADNVLPRFDPLRYEKSEEDRNLLEAYNLIMRGDKDGAQEFLDEILGEPTEQVKPLLRAVESTLYEEDPENQEVRFYMERVMSKSDVVVKSQKKTENPATKEEPAKTAPKPDKKAEPQPQKAEDTPSPDIKKDNKEVEELYAKACAASGAKRVMLLQKAADAGSLEAMYDLADCYWDGEGVEKNVPLSIKWMTKAADAGYVKAQTALGAAYFQGMEGLDQNYALSEKYLLMAANKDNTDAQAYIAYLYIAMEDYSKAMVWARKAAQMEHPQACFALGRIYDEGLGVEVNHKEGLKWYEKAANGGDADAQNIVGNIYSAGELVAQDDKKAFKYYQMAAVQGHLWGMYNLSGCYVGGQGTDLDLLKAGEWLRKAAEGGLQEAIDTLNENPQFKDDFQYEEKQLTEEEAKALYDAVDKKTDPNKLTDLQQAAEAGDVWGMFFYACLYANSNSVNRNYELAVEYYTKAANAGNPKAMNNLGLCYFNGEGITQDYTEAAKWVRKAADAGNALAMANLGACYESGKGVNQDYAEAARWYRKAADAGNAWAIGQIGIFYENGKGVNQNYAEAAKWYRKAADAGNAWAMGQIGIFYENGKGVNQNYAEAAKWYRKGADAGDSNAMFGLGNCYINGKGVIQDDNEGLNYFCMGAESGNLLSMTNVGWCYEFGRGTEANPVEAMKWYQKALDNGYQMDDWLSQRMKECKAKIPSDEVKFPTAWVTQGDDTYITIHFHFIVHNHKDRNLTFKFYTESLSPNSTKNSNNIIFDDMVDYTAMCSYDNSEWKDYRYNLFQNIAKYNLQYGNRWKLKTTMSVYDDQGRLLGSGFIKYIVNHESRMVRSDKLIFVGLS